VALGQIRVVTRGKRLEDRRRVDPRLRKRRDLRRDAADERFGRDRVAVGNDGPRGDDAPATDRDVGINRRVEPDQRPLLDGRLVEHCAVSHHDLVLEP